MEIKVTTIEGLKRRISGTIEADIVQKRIDKALKDTAKHAQIRGFRPGKAPKSMLMRRYGREIKADVAASLLEEHYEKALEQSHLEPIGPPEIERAEIEDDNTMSFDIMVEVAPKVSVQQYKDLEAKRPILKATDEEIDSRIESIREQNATLEPMQEDRGVEQGDWVDIDFEGFIDGEPFEGGKAEKYRLEVGAQRLLPDLEQGLEGMKNGETKDIEVQFPENYQAAEFAGKPAVFKVVLNEIMVRQIPEADDDLAKDVGEDSLDALKEKIRGELQQQKDGRAQEDAKDSLLDDLLAKNPVEAPGRMVERRLDMMQERLKRGLVMQGLPEEQAVSLVDSSRDSGRQRAERDVKVGFLLEEIAREENLEVSDEELENKYQEISESSDKTKEAVAAMFQKEGQVEALKHQILEEKTVELLLSHATIIDEEPKTPAESDSSEEDADGTENEAEE